MNNRALLRIYSNLVSALGNKDRSKAAKALEGFLDAWQSQGLLVAELAKGLGLTRTHIYRVARNENDPIRFFQRHERLLIMIGGYAEKLLEYDPKLDPVIIAHDMKAAEMTPERFVMAVGKLLGRNVPASLEPDLRRFLKKVKTAS